MEQGSESTPAKEKNTRRLATEVTRLLPDRYNPFATELRLSTSQLCGEIHGEGRDGCVQVNSQIHKPCMVDPEQTSTQSHSTFCLLWLGMAGATLKAGQTLHTKLK